MGKYRLTIEQRDARIRFKQQTDADFRLERVKQANTCRFPVKQSMAAVSALVIPGRAWGCGSGGCIGNRRYPVSGFIDRSSGYAHCASSCSICRRNGVSIRAGQRKSYHPNNELACSTLLPSRQRRWSFTTERVANSR